MNKCTGKCGGYYFFIGLMTSFIILMIFLTIDNYKLWRGDLWDVYLLIAASLLCIIYLLCCIKNFCVYVEGDTLVHVNWRKKKRVYSMDDFKKLDTEGNKALTFRFNKGKVTIWGYYKNFGPVAADMLQLLQRTQPEMYEQQKKLLR